MFFDRAAVGSLTAERDGRPVVTAESIELAPRRCQAGYSGTFGVQRFTADTQASGGGRGSTVMADLGYPQLTGNVSGTGSWNPQSGALTLDPLQVAVDDAGT